jgi:hypothetical protein
MPSRSVTPRIWADAGWLKCKTPYLEAFNDALKTEIDWKLRQWNRQEKLWLIDPSCLDELVAVTRKYFPNVQVGDQPGPATGPRNRAETGREPRQEARQRPSAVRDDGTYQTVASLLRSASTDALKRVYWALAADFHPDRGGDGDMLRRLNVAWDKIQMERGLRKPIR